MTKIWTVASAAAIAAATVVAANVYVPSATAQAVEPAGQPQTMNTDRSAAGKVKKLDVSARLITLDNDITYTVAPKLDLAPLKEGQEVTVTYKTDPDKEITKIIMKDNPAKPIE